MTEKLYKRCPFCSKNAMQENGKRYHFDVKAWVTRTYTLYTCRWCKRSLEVIDVDPR